MTYFDDPLFTMAVIGVLLMRAGGKATFTQEDFDMIAHRKMIEDYDGNGTVTLSMEKPS